MPALFSNTSIEKESCLIGLVALALFTAGLWSQPFVEFESRFALFAQEMWRHGPSLFPTTYGAPYPDYPATSTLLIWFFSLAFGGVTKLSAVLPTAIASAFNLVITYRLLARISRRWAFATICFELLTFHFLAEARSISLDQMVATVTLLAFYLAYTHAGRQSLVVSPVLSLLACLFMGFVIRGPLGVVIPSAVVGSYYFLSRQWKALVYFGLLAFATVVVCWFGLLELAKLHYGDAFVRDVIQMQVSGRMDQVEDLGRSYYFTSSVGNYALAYPVAVCVVLLLAPALLQRVRKPLNDDAISLVIYLLMWVLVVMTGLSIPTTKKVRYLLPMVPAIAALAAYPFYEGFDQLSPRAGIFFRRLLEWFLCALPCVALLGLWKAFQYLQQHALSLQIPFALIAVLLLVAQVMVIGIQWRAKPKIKTVGVLCGAVTCLWLLDWLVVEPAMLAVHDTQRLVRQVETLRQQQPGQLVFFRVGKDAAAIKYLVNVDYDLQPQFVSRSTELDLLAAKPAYVMLQDADLPLLQASERLQHLTPVVHDRFDHGYYSVFYLP